MHPLEQFTRKTEFAIKPTTQTTYRGAILEPGAPVSIPPWAAAAPAKTVAADPATPSPTAPPPPPAPSPDEIAAPYKRKISELEGQLTQERQRMSSAVERIEQDLTHFESNARELIVDMALIAAQVFVGSEASVEAIRNVVSKAIESLPLTPTTVLYVAPQNADALKEQPPSSLKIAVDPTLKPGDCRLSSENGGVDGRLETRAQELRQRLLTALLDGRGDAE
jgi:flagellar biosynthesis/type III secretory pathway protein FliH